MKLTTHDAGRPAATAMPASNLPVGKFARAGEAKAGADGDRLSAMSAALRAMAALGREASTAEYRQLRARIEATIDTLIAALDALDGDADLEDAADSEPSLGWTYRFDGVPVRPTDLRGDDREEERENDEDGGDAEPDADDEANGDDELSEGWPERDSQCPHPVGSSPGAGESAIASMRLLPVLPSAGAPGDVPLFHVEPGAPRPAWLVSEEEAEKRGRTPMIWACR